MMNQETLNFTIISTIEEEFNRYKSMMKTLSNLIGMSLADIDFSEDDRIGLSALMDYIIEGQERIFEDGKEKVKKAPKYILARASEIIGDHHKSKITPYNLEEISAGLQYVINVFGQAYPEAPELLEKIERIAARVSSK